MPASLQREIQNSVRAFAYRSRLAQSLPELESGLLGCMDYLHTDTLTGHGWMVTRGENGDGLVYEPAPDVDVRQLYLPQCESAILAKALAKEKERKKQAPTLF